MPPDLTSNLAADIAWTLFRAIAHAVVALTIWLTGVVTYRLFLHPLARVPGPRWAAVSNLWHARQAKHGRMAILGRMLHQRYGPVVRVGPNEVWFNSKEAFDVIYGTGRGYEKSDFYLATSLAKPRIDLLLRPHPQDSLDLLSERDMKRYRLQRRLIGRTYQTANLLKHEPAIDAVLEEAVSSLTALNGAEVDLKMWMHMIAVECLGACVLSWSPKMLRHGTDWGSSIHSYQGWRRKSVLGLFPLVTKLSMVSNVAGRLVRMFGGVSFQVPENFKTFFPDVNRRVSRRVRGALQPKPQKDNRVDLLADLIQLHKDKPEFTESYLRKMAITNFGAGHETMASTLTSTIAMIASHPDIQQQTAAEVRNTPSPTSYAQTTTTLPLTRAATKEAMRLRPVLSMSLPRRVPSTGPLHLHGYSFPTGTTVGCNPVGLHCNAELFGADAGAYDPGRWLSGDAAETAVLERYSLSWGGGSRACPGRNLAELVVAKTVAAILERFDVKVARMPPEDEMPSYFLSMMAGVKVQFKAAQDGSVDDERGSQRRSGGAPNCRYGTRLSDVNEA